MILEAPARDAVGVRFQRAQAMLAGKDFAGAVREYEAVLELRPDHADALNNRGSARAALGDRDGAMADYDAALAIDPSCAAALNNRAVSQAAAGKLQAALADLHAALRIDPSYAAAYENCATVHGNLFEHVKAVANYDRAIALYGSDPRHDSRRCLAFVKRAMARYHLRQWRASALGLREAFRMDALLASGTLAHAIDQNLRDRGAAVLDDCDRYLASRPADFLTLFRRALTHLILGHEAAFQTDRAAAFALLPSEGTEYGRTLLAAVRERLAALARPGLLTPTSPNTPSGT